ncbi:TPA: hypothetical protein EYP37_13725 [Candidatus Poribacteria bacterium]|nr:hypothetical protein [Candidatus Poribacteria bacterium]
MRRSNVSPLLIGWASADVTPDRPVILRGQFHARISKGVRDPITVTALALERDGTRCVMVSADSVAIPDSLLRGVRAKLLELVDDLDPGRVFISATHSHTAPATCDEEWEDMGPDVMKPSEYAAFFVEKAADCIARAWRNRSPGRIAWGLGHAVVGHNRRQARKDGSSLMYGDTSLPEFSHIEGYEDHSVDQLFTFNGEGRLTGVVVNIACPAQVSENDRLISADFWHDVRCELRRRLGDDLFILPQCGAAGDQSPHLMYYRRAEMRMLRLQGLIEDDDALRPTQQRQEIARRIGEAVHFTLKVASREQFDAPIFMHETRTLHLPRRIITEEEAAEARREAERYERRMKELSDRPPYDVERSRCFGLRRWYNGVIKRYELQKAQPTYPMELHVVRLADIAFATNPFELYLDYGVRIKARSKAVQTFIVQLTGGGTYLPTARSVRGGGYGSVPASNIVGPEGGDMLVEETLSTIERMFSPH